MEVPHSDADTQSLVEPDVEGQRSVRSRESIAARLRAFEQMDAAALRAEWRRQFRAHPPKNVGRDLLMLGVAWRIQEKAYGGLGAATKCRLADLVNTLQRDGDVTRNRVARLKPGAKLLREWHGETHTVVVHEDGFEWRGTRWRSLSLIAREITGAHWSGPRFFGLKAKGAPVVASLPVDAADA